MGFDEKRMADEPSDYLGETAPDGTPLGRGRLRFGDGTVWRGSIDWHAQRGSGVWSYPDGSSAAGGFTLCRETPALRFCSPSGKVFVRFLSRFLSEDGASDPEADAVCAELKRRFDAAGVILEYNARALLCDLILAGELPADAAFPPAGSPGVFRIPDALAMTLSERIILMKKPGKKRKKTKKMIKIVIAPDSFKGSISAADASEAIEEGLRSVLGDRLLTVKKPIADGGEGTLDALVPFDGRISLDVTGPDGDPVRAEYGIACGTAVIEMARASGLTLSSVRRAAQATTYGIGELIADAIDRGIRHIMLTAGGSATNDGGCGMFAALGAVFRDSAGDAFIPTGGTLSRIASIDLSGIRTGFAETEFVIAADIKNPLLGPEGATYVYGQQKGATDPELDMMERGMASYAAIVEGMCGRPVSELPGSGAAGGIGIPLIAFAGAVVSRGIDTVLKTARFDEALKGADAVITGEGKLDLQSLFGKAVSGVASAAAKAKVPVDVICGCLGAEREELKSLGLREIFALSDFAPDARSSIEDAGRWLKEAAAEYAKKLFA